MKKTEIKAYEGHLEIVKSANDLPQVLPNLDKKELFNILQETNPIKELVDKPFHILGIVPEYVDVPKDGYVDEDGVVIDESVEVEYVERLRVTIITNIGAFHSFSTTFNKALAKAINVFGNEFTLEQFKITTKLIGSGKNAKVIYLVKVV